MFNDGLRQSHATLGEAVSHRVRRACSSSVLSVVLALPLAACSSMCHRVVATGRVLDDENALLLKLRVERADPRVSTKLQADPDLKSAEEHLQTVIDAITRSNAVIKAAF